MEKLSEREKEWLYYLFENDFLGREILIEQLNKIEVTRESGEDYFSIKINVLGNTKLFPYGTRVPVEMICYQKTAAPIIFLMHVIKGRVDEIEIITADSSWLNIDKIELTNRKYIIEPALLILD